MQHTSLDINKTMHCSLNNSIRLATAEDLPHIGELWGNYASLRQIQDYENWNWEINTTQSWLHKTRETLEHFQHFVSICDFQDNGFTGFLTATVDNAQYKLNINEFYIRPKERTPELLQQMILYTAMQAQQRYKLSDNQLTIQIEVLDHERILLENLLPDLTPSACKFIFKY